ncbi:MAG: pantetheine-phosphate adenylyltransferase [Candidatus Altiarchaeota archaeon]|nr:pantetheine-phosphate adenylyltransferase [Candidatus Altiarchaeota archaeon]
MTFKKTIVGGTFDNFHRGHEAILRTAFDISDFVTLGISSDDFAKKFRTEQTESYDVRSKSVKSFCKGLGKRFEIREINDFYGPSTIDGDFDCIVVSEETALRAKEINAVRFKKGLREMVMVVVPFALARDGKPISSYRIRGGEIDERGEPS